MKETIKNLVIDLGVVLLDLTPARCFENFRKLGVTNIDTLVDAHYKHGLFLELESGMISPEGFRNELRTITGLPELGDEQIDEAWNSFLATIPTYKLDFLLELRRHYKVYLLSNTNIIHWEWVLANDFSYKGHTVTDFFDKTYLSYELHLVKPDRRIFEHLIEDAGIDPNETFFIDDAAENCRMAETLGIETYMPKAEEDWRGLIK